MAKLLVMSAMIALIAIPAFAARDPNPRRGLRLAVRRVAMYYAFYAFALMYLWQPW